MNLLEGLVPSAVVVEERRQLPADLDLHPDEAACVAGAVERRRLEFAAVRCCARLALARLGRAPIAILPDEGGAPRWPPGVVGSMTHCAGYHAAALARSEDVTGLGIDAEPSEPLPNGILESISSPEEAAQVTRLAEMDGHVMWDRLLFSAKESVYKSWYPLTGRWLGFEQVKVSFSSTDGTFLADLLVDGPVVHGQRLTEFRGAWTTGCGVLVTAIVVP